MMRSRPLQRSHRVLTAVAAAAVALACTPPARGAGESPDVTVYGQDLALVHEHRSVILTGGADTLRLGGVPERLEFGSVRLVPASGRVTRLAWRWDVPAGEDLLARALGRRVRVQARDHRTVEGVLTAVDGSWLLVLADDGTLHSVARAAVEEVEHAGPAAPLAARPGIEAVVEGARAGRQDVELTYLTGGLSWSAEHTLVRHGEREAEWSSRAQVQNGTSVTWTAAALALVAGEPRRVGGMPPPRPVEMMMKSMTASAPAGADLAQQAFSEYHLYTLERPAVLREHETQSLAMLEPRTIRVTPRYLYRGGDPAGVTAQMLVPNVRADGLGVPIPAGRVRVYEPDAAGRVHFAGEDAVRHTPEGDTLTISVGQAFDLSAERRELDSRRISDRERENSVAIVLRNHKRTGVTITVEERPGGDIEVVRSSHPVARREAGALWFDVPVAAGASVTLTYTIRQRF